MLFASTSSLVTLTKGSFLVDLEKYILMTERWFCFSRSRLFVALTLLSASVLFETGDILFDGISQQLEISLLKMHFIREGSSSRVSNLNVSCWYALVMFSPQLE